MKKVFLLLLLLPVLGWAQKKHIVGPKETFFSIGRLYKVHPRELAEFNNIPYGTGLTIGQVLKIPAKTTMAPLPPVNDNEKPVVVTKAPEKKEKIIIPPVRSMPIYHRVKKKENLYQISRLYNKVPIDDLRKWNKLTSDALSEGINLIVGYKTDETAAKQSVKKDTAVTTIVKPDPVIEKKPEFVVEKPVIPEVKETVMVSPPVVTSIEINFNGGVFKSLFESQTKTGDIIQEDGQAGVFKSTSGWSDGKYYCLHNTAAVGTIVKITNSTNGRSVYAKVLDVIPDIKQNSGLLIRISNAAAAELQAGELNFICIINYSK